METFRFKTSDKGKLFDIKLLGVEEQMTEQYEIIRKLKNTKRVLFYALVNGQIEIVDTSFKTFIEMTDLMLDFARRYEKKLTDGCFIRILIETVPVENMEFLDYKLTLIPSDLYNSQSPEVKEQIKEFDFTFEKALDFVKDTYSKDSHWSNKIKIN